MSCEHQLTTVVFRSKWLQILYGSEVWNKIFTRRSWGGDYWFNWFQCWIVILKDWFCVMLNLRIKKVNFWNLKFPSSWGGGNGFMLFPKGISTKWNKQPYSEFEPTLTTASSRLYLSSSCRASSTDFPDWLLPFISIIYCFWQVPLDYILYLYRAIVDRF